MLGIYRPMKEIEIGFERSSSKSTQLSLWMAGEVMDLTLEGQIKFFGVTVEGTLQIVDDVPIKV